MARYGEWYLQWKKLEHNINWFAVSTLPQVRKLWARIDLNMVQGDYSVLIYNFYPTSLFKGSKSLILSTTSEFGSKNPSFGFVLITISKLNWYKKVHSFWPQLYTSSLGRQDAWVSNRNESNLSKRNER